MLNLWKKILIPNVQLNYVFAKAAYAKGQNVNLYNIYRVPKVGDRRKRHLRVKDYGYQFNMHDMRDQLPRIKDCPIPVKNSVQDAGPDPWSRQQALFGQNDYIDILGDGTIHPAQLLYHVPGWLRGFPGDHKANELVRLIHYRNIYKEKMQRNTPRRYLELCKQIKFLIKRHNYRKQDEISHERKLGLWDEEPAFYYQDGERRSYEDMP